MFLRATSARAAVVGDGTGVNLALPSPRVRPDAVRDALQVQPFALSLPDEVLGGEGLQNSRNLRL